MPRLSKKYKHEWQFFLDHRNRMKYNDLCKKCVSECKQSFRAIIIDRAALEKGISARTVRDAKKELGDTLKSRITDGRRKVFWME